jgi:hypothetical protein
MNGWTHTKMRLITDLILVNVKITTKYPLSSDDDSIREQTK